MAACVRIVLCFFEFVTRFGQGGMSKRVTRFFFLVVRAEHNRLQFGFLCLLFFVLWFVWHGLLHDLGAWGTTSARHFVLIHFKKLQLAIEKQVAHFINITLHLVAICGYLFELRFGWATWDIDKG